MDVETRVGNGEAPAVSYDGIIAAAERRAQAIVREAEEEACRILEESVRMAFKAQPTERRPRRWAILTILLAGCALAASLALVVGIAVGQM